MIKEENKRKTSQRGDSMQHKKLTNKKPSEAGTSNGKGD